MYLGQIVETASGETVYQDPRHPYTQSLISAIPVPDPTMKKERIILSGDVPSPITLPRVVTSILDAQRALSPARRRRLNEETTTEHSVRCHLESNAEYQARPH